MIDPLREEVIGPAATSVESATVSSVFVPAVNAAVDDMPMSDAAISDDPIDVRRLSDAAGVTRVPPEPAALQPVAFTKSI